MNVLFILSDQHNPEFAGCYGQSRAHTPHIDSIARRGVRFENAYCVSPFCVPARAAMFSGRYAHEISIWDNTLAYDGTPASWARYFQDNNVLLATIGKLDFAPGVDTGIEQELFAQHRNSMDICALFRDQPVPRLKMHVPEGILTREGGQPAPHELKVRDRAIQWLQQDRPRDRPWILNVNFNHPHPGWHPLPALWEKYRGTLAESDLPAKYGHRFEDLHPADQSFAIHSCGRYYTREQVLRMHEAYLAVIEEMDGYVGQLLQALDDEGLRDETLVIYCSDHGELAGAHVAWSKCSMYEDSIRVPWVMAGAGIRPGTVDRACVSHLDVFPTICEAVGLPQAWDKRGMSLLGPDRPAFVMSEFHGNGFPDGVFAVRSGHWKLVEAVHDRPQLYNLETDPQELHDLLRGPRIDPAAMERAEQMRRMLSTLCSAEAVDARAKADQARLKAELAASGRLLDELEKRGFERRADRLVNVMPEPAIP